MITVFYTQDLPHERDWLKQQYPDLDFRETYSSGKWNNLRPNSAVEIPFVDRNIPVKNLLKNHKIAQQIKVVYDQIAAPELEFGDISWTHTDQLCINQNLKFEQPNNKKFDSYMLFTFGRCGSLFLESILQKKMKSFAHHYCLDDHINGANFPDSDDVLMIFLYRQNWWNWIVSTAIGQKIRLFHYDDQVDWDKITPFKLTMQKIAHLHQQQKMIFNFWCNLRLKYPKRRIDLYTFEDIIPRNQHLTAHQRIPYDTKKIVLNYNESKMFFEEKYLRQWQEVEKNALSHLHRMQVVPTSGNISLD